MHFISRKKTQHAKRNIAQSDVLKYKRRREGRRWQDMSNVCTFCPRGLTRASAARLRCALQASGFSLASARVRPLGQNVQTLAISCQRLPSLLRLYLNKSHCAILRFVCCVFLLASAAIKTPRRGATWNRSRPHRCRTTRSKKLPKLVFKTHTTTGKPNARAGHGSAPGTRKWPALDRAGHTP